MNHSTWDLEVHAREMQRRRLGEADRARQIETARQHANQTRVPAAQFSISRLITAFRDCLSPRRSATDRAAAPALAGPALLPLSVEKPRLSPDARSRAPSHPYAAMMVLARGTSTQSAPQPCAAGDC
jgi:hypothetical protein